MKHIVKLIVTSSTYRQSSQTTKSDPGNRWYTRQNRWRLDAEMIRDTALKSSGLLVADIGGPSVKPYQPGGYWKHLNFPRRRWTADAGEKQYRRGLYTYWCRTFLHPAMRAFDASTREECSVQRPRSNTPLQALVLLNDPSYVEAARKLAETSMRAAKTDADRLNIAFRRVLQRSPAPIEKQILFDLLASQRRLYAGDADLAKLAVSVGLTKPPADLPAVDLAAWTAVSRVLLNLHEGITRQ